MTRCWGSSPISSRWRAEATVLATSRAAFPGNKVSSFLLLNWHQREKKFAFDTDQRPKRLVLLNSSSGQTEWRHYATLHHARSMGQAAALDDGSILLLGGQVPCVFVVLLCSYCDCNNTLTFIGKTTPRDVYCPVGKRRKECSRLTQPAVTMIPTALGGRRSRRWRGWVLVVLQQGDHHLVPRWLLMATRRWSSRSSTATTRGAAPSACPIEGTRLWAL